MKRSSLLSAIVLLCISGVLSTADAGEFNTVLSIGDKAPAWEKLPGTDGKTHSLSDLKDKKLVVVVFTCNSCPYATDYEDRIIEFAKKHASDVGVVAINVNNVPEDKPEKMRERAEKKKFPYPYLHDQTQKIAHDFGAVGTPEFFVLSPERKIVYMGAMDDDSDAKKVKVNYLDAAITAALAGKEPEKKETFFRGCRIRYAKKRGG
jgi:peroxiredoxin